MKRIVLLVGSILYLSSLSAMGGQDLLELRIICPNNYEFRMEYAQIIADEFEAVGIDVSLYFISLDELIERVYGSGGEIYERGGFDVAIFGLW